MLSNIALPEGLTADVPRPVRFTARAQVTRLFLLLLLVSVVGGFLGRAARNAGDMNALRTQGRMTSARVFDKYTSDSSHYRSTTHYLDYGFDGGAVWVNGREVVSPDVYAQTQPGATLAVTFLPSDPRHYCVGEATLERVEEDLYEGFWEGAVAFVLVGLLLLCTEFTFRHHLFLLRDGSITAATVTGLGKRPVGKQETYTVTYQFTADGRRYQNKASCNEAFYKNSRPGQVLIVLYDPANVSRNMPYRMLTGAALPKR